MAVGDFVFVHAAHLAEAGGHVVEGDDDMGVGGIEYADEDVSRIIATGEVSLEKVLDRSLHKLMQRLERL